MRIRVILTWAVLTLLAIVLAAAGCSAPASSPPSSTPTTTPTGTPSPTPTAGYSQYQAAYLVLEKYPDYFWCDPDFYPIAREGGEQANALAQYPTIRANQPEFAAILDRLALPIQGDYTDSQKLDIYREHKKITVAIQMTANQDNYRFTLAVGKGQGQRLIGNITDRGVITIISQESSFNTCPICLSEGTLIDTPRGPLAVETLQIGDTVWSVDADGERVVAPLLKTSRTAVPSGFQILRIVLEDGRQLTVSPNHPSSEGKALGGYEVGERLDGALIVQLELEPYAARFTYDLLPDSANGWYWANGILLGSTLKR